MSRRASSPSTRPAGAVGRPSLRARASGLLLHPTSLPGPFGTGDLGPQARRFADLLAESGQTWWQMLPIGPAGAGNSPYSSPSSFAGSPLLISLELLVEDGLLEPKDVEAPPFPEGRADHAGAEGFKEPRLRKAFGAFSERGSSRLWGAFRAFHAENQAWLEDYALYRALKDHHRGAPWTEWPPQARDRRFRRWKGGMKQLGEEAFYHQFVQFLFQRQWQGLRRHCARRGVGLIGDVPIFAALESADVWAHRELFHLDEGGRPTAVSGVPPDYFSETGQLWGNPLYRWDILRERGYEWWLERLHAAASRFDAVRLDHFIGFERYWEIPAGSRTAREGRWIPGPGADFFEKVSARHEALELIAEDLGSVTPGVTALRDRFDLPGMRVLQFAFGTDRQADEFLPHNYPRRCVAYTGTHDNDTTAGWFNDPGTAPGSRSQEQIRRERDNALRYLKTDGREIHWDMIGAVLRSTADTAIVPVQDVLGLGAEARMNRPGIETGNWEWRLPPGALTEEVLRRLKELTEQSGRRRSP